MSSKSCVVTPGAAWRGSADSFKSDGEVLGPWGGLTELYTFLDAKPLRKNCGFAVL